jgi:peroxiredoxin
MKNFLERPLMRLIALGASGLIAAAAFVLLTSRPAAPDVEFTTLQGERVSLHELRGKVVYVNFWATSCATCIKEMPAVIETYQRLAPHGLELFGVAMSYDPPEYVRNYAREYRLPFKVVLDTQGTIAEAFGHVNLTPTAVLIDKRGREFKRIVGEPDFAALRSQIEKELAE